MKKKLRIVLVVLLLLSGSCQKDNGLNNKGSLPFTTYKRVPIVQVLLNGKVANFLIDTGASTSLLDITVAKKYGFAYNVIEDEHVYGIGGQSHLYHVEGVHIFCCGNNVEVYFKGSDLSAIRKQLNVVGIIGADHLNRRDLIIDFKHDVIRRGDYEEGVHYYN